MEASSWVFYLAPASTSPFCYDSIDGVLYRDVLSTHLFDLLCGCLDPFPPLNLPLLPSGTVPPAVLYFFHHVFLPKGKKADHFIHSSSPGVRYQLCFPEAEPLPQVFVRQGVAVGSAVYFYTAGRFSKKSEG